MQSDEIDQEILMREPTGSGTELSEGLLWIDCAPVRAIYSVDEAKRRVKVHRIRQIYSGGRQRSPGRQGSSLLETGPSAAPCASHCSAFVPGSMMRSATSALRSLNSAANLRMSWPTASDIDFRTRRTSL